MSEGLGADGVIHLQSVAAGMDTHLAEIGAKPRFHVGAHRVRQWTATPFAQADLGFDLGSGLEAVGQWSCRFGLDRFGFFLLSFGLSLQGISARLGEKLGLDGLLIVFRLLIIPHLPLYERGD
jgi:hypothetical protein